MYLMIKRSNVVAVVVDTPNSSALSLAKARMKSARAQGPPPPLQLLESGSQLLGSSTA